MNAAQLSIVPTADAETTASSSAEASALAKKIAIYIATLQHVTRSLPNISRFVEDSAGDIVSQFRTMATVSITQAENIDKALDMSRYIHLEEELLTFDHCIDELYRPMSDSINNILEVSKLAMSMVLAIGQAADNIKRVEKYIDEIQEITKQTNMLAMNTQIEAARAGEAGKSFQFIAGEVKNLSQDIKRLSHSMRGDITEVATSVRESFSVIDQLANYDMTKNMALKSRIDAVMNAITKQNHDFLSLLANAASMNRENAQNISSMIMNIQFQDRTSQVIGDMTTMLKTVQQFVAERLPAEVHLLEDADTNALIDTLIKDIKLTDMRRQLISSLYDLGILSVNAKAVQEHTMSNQHQLHAAALDNSEGDIELF
jgi:methyl-accepting chemotaxis protein